MAGMASLLMLSMKVSNISAFTETEGFEVTANFANIGGLKVRSPVSMAGVVVGRVAKIQSLPRLCVHPDGAIGDDYLLDGASVG